MDISQRYSIWKIRGFSRQKFLFLLNCLLVYPIFRKHHHEVYIGDKIECLTVYRFNLLRIVKYRQNAISVLYIKHYKQLEEKHVEIMNDIIQSIITYENMNQIEMEIEGLCNLITTDEEPQKELVDDFNYVLRLSEREYTNIVQAYHSFYQKTLVLNRRRPWKYILEIFSFDELAMVY